MVGFGDFYLDFRELGAEFLCKISGNGILRIKMPGIDEVQTAVPGVPELIVFYIGSDKGIAASSNGVHDLTGAGTTADRDLTDGLTSIHITQNFTA